MRKLAGTACVLAFFVVIGAAVAAGEETVRMRDDEFTVWPVEDLVERGFDVPPVPREKNAAWVYIEAVNAYVDLPDELKDGFKYASQTAWPTGLDKLDEYLQAPGNRAAMEKVRQASQMDRCRMPYFGDPGQSVMAILLPNLSHMRFLGKLLVADGRRSEAQGRRQEALDNYLTAMRIGEHVGQGLTLIEGLVGLAVWGLADRALVDAVLRQPLSITELRKLQLQLNKRASRIPTTIRGLRGERTFGPALVDELCSRPLLLVGNLVEMLGAKSDEWFGSVDATSNPHDGWGKLELRVGQLMFPDRTIKKHMLDYYDLVLERADRGPSRGAELEFDEEQYISRKIPKWDVLSRTLLPSLSRATVLGERARVELAATRAIVAIRIHTLQNDGKAPETLNEVEATLPQGAMVDPFSDELLVYRRTHDGWVLYSVGPNLIDDDGQRGRKWDDFDIVYKFPPPPIEPFDRGPIQ